MAKLKKTVRSKPSSPRNDAGDLQARGFLIGATAGRTTLNGEGLQHRPGAAQVEAAERSRAGVGAARGLKRALPRTRSSGFVSTMPDDQALAFSAGFVRSDAG